MVVRRWVIFVEFFFSSGKSFIWSKDVAPSRPLGEPSESHRRLKPPCKGPPEVRKKRFWKVDEKNRITPRCGAVQAPRRALGEPPEVKAPLQGATGGKERKELGRRRKIEIEFFFTSFAYSSGRKIESPKRDRNRIFLLHLLILQEGKSFASICGAVQAPRRAFGEPPESHRRLSSPARGHRR
jgi:hypothetical protein